MSDGGILPNDRTDARDASPVLSRALDAAVEGFDRARQETGFAALTPAQKQSMRPHVAAAVEAYHGVVGGGHVG